MQSFLREQSKNGKKLEDVIDLVTPDATSADLILPYSPSAPRGPPRPFSAA